jgi:molecular chaperone GrpE
MSWKNMKETVDKHQEETPADLREDEIETAAEAGEAEAGPAESDIEQLKREISNLKDQLLRRAAEFENFRRRTREEQADLIRYANEKLIVELLPVADDFRRSLAFGREHPAFDSFYKGIELVYAKFLKMLEARGVRPIETAGAEFNVDFHDALLQIPRSDLPPGAIIDEIETGYTLNDRVIRHAKVTVAAEAPPPVEDNSNKGPTE